MERFKNREENCTRCRHLKVAETEQHCMTSQRNTARSPLHTHTHTHGHREKWIPFATHVLAWLFLTNTQKTLFSREMWRFQILQVVVGNYKYVLSGRVYFFLVRYRTLKQTRWLTCARRGTKCRNLRGRGSACIDPRPVLGPLSITQQADIIYRWFLFTTAKVMKIWGFCENSSQKFSMNKLITVRVEVAVSDWCSVKGREGKVTCCVICDYTCEIATLLSLVVNTATTSEGRYVTPPVTSSLENGVARFHVVALGLGFAWQVWGSWSCILSLTGLDLALWKVAKSSSLLRAAPHNFTFKFAVECKAKNGIKNSLKGTELIRNIVAHSTLP